MLRLKNNKAIAIAMAFVFCMTFLAPAFVAPQVAEAAAAYRSLSVPTFATNVPAADLGVIEIDIPSGLEIKANDVLSISLPAGVTLGTGVGTPAFNPAGKGIAVTNSVPVAPTYVDVYVPADHPLTGMPNGLTAALTVLDTAGVVNAANLPWSAAVAAPQAAVLGTTINNTLGYIGSAKIGATGQSIDIEFANNGTAERGVMYIYVNDAVLEGVSGDITASIMGSTSAIPMGQVIVGKATTSGGTALSVKSVRTMGTAPTAIDVITLIETTTNTFNTADTVQFKLPVGFTWDSPGVAGPNWGFATPAGLIITAASTAAVTAAGGGAACSPGEAAAIVQTLAAGGTIAQAAAAGFAVAATPITLINAEKAATAAAPVIATYQPSINGDKRILDLSIPAGFAVNKTTTGRIDILNATIKADDSVAKKGDVVVTVTSSQNKVTAQDITVAKFGEYKANGVEGTVNELTAGKADQKLGKFFIEEEIPGSLVSSRVIKLTLPEGVKWWGGYRNATPINTAAVIQGGITPAVPVFTTDVDENGSSDNGRSIQTTITNTPNNNSGKIEFKDFKVDVAPDFEGEIKVTVSGAAGAVGEVKVATVVPAVELSAENVKNIIIGQQKQLTGELVIKETKKEKIAFRNTAEWVSGTAGAGPVSNNCPITLTLPAGARWADLPTVEVTEGDLQLDLNGMFDSSVGAGGDNRLVTIPVKSSSLTPSTIKVSNILATVDRTVPEGDFKVSIGGLSVNEVPNVFPQASLPSQVVAKVVTPAPIEGTTGAGTGQFRINSNIYEVNGVAKVMDAPAYVKNNRTYVPVRFLGYVLGLTDADMVWDAATQKVTFTKGEVKVELTIGSTTYTVNGESKTMDVAPEINNDRTMLPARYVAEALGAMVGWDPATQTVLISK